ncbi:BolA protein [Sulfitobacter noctilucicola]|uniref:BolA protein n=1 Tax=Sulfitobacter noctilucicola TaxID=1342301 RepID=A0A7W6M876_9RHOB|nr:BolA family protein [Sulfitobacter noctilucicola]KIN64613.1 BolA protein [Sulfitobacter noctilucicola]MBB4174236.1 BolA protein [Sulfitobacter noctilucicola]
MAKVQEIEERLRAALNPHEMEVIDDSESHRGHAGFREGGGSHFNVMVRSETFKGLNRLARHRAVHSAIGPELMGRIHALALDLDV